MKNHPVVDALAKAVKGLQYISETEAPMEAFLWEDDDKLTKDKLLELTGIEEGTSVETMTLDDFFRTISEEDGPKFYSLARELKDHLSGVKVYKIGDEAKKQVYVVGKTDDGKLAGIKTTVVET